MTLTPESIIDHTDWVRKLAYRLVRDTHLAEDLAQATCVAALESPPATSNVRGWLATVMRNFWLQSHRRDVRRTRSEWVAAKSEEDVATVDLVERANYHRVVVESVLELDEPYRETLLMRFFEDATPTEIAKQKGIPLATVKSRLARGLERLRGLLDARHNGNRKVWSSALLALSLPPAESVVIGALTMKLKFVFVAAVAATGLFFAWPIISPTAAMDEPNSVEPEAGVSVASESSHGNTSGDATPMRRTRVIADASAGEPSKQPEKKDLGSFAGRVLFADGRPAAEVELVFGDDETKITSDSQGQFVLAVPAQGRALRSADDRYVTIVPAQIGPNVKKLTQPPAVVVAEALHVSGQVVDGEGQVLAGVRIGLRLPSDFTTRFEKRIEYRAMAALQKATSNEQGEFHLDRLVSVSGAFLAFELGGYVPTILPLADGQEYETVVLTKAVAEKGSLEGIVIDEAGIPVPGAFIGLLVGGTVADERGRFVLSLKSARGGQQLYAFAPGRLPGHHRLPQHDDPEFPAFVTLVIGGEPLSLSGHLVDSTGEPLGGERIWVKEQTFFGSHKGELVTIEGALSQTEDARWSYVMTEPDGSWRLEGLRPVDYTVCTTLDGSLHRIEAGPFPAGMQDVRVIVPEEAVAEEISGRVLDTRHRPVEGVTVSASCDAFEIDFEGRGKDTRHLRGASTVTDAEGYFVLENIAKDSVFLVLSGAGVMMLEYGRYDTAGYKKGGRQLDDIVITVDRHAQVRAECEPGFADSIQAFDGNGRPQLLTLFRGGGSKYTGMSQPITDGQTKALSSPDSVTTIKFYLNNKEVASVPVEMRIDRVNVVRPVQ